MSGLVRTALRLIAQPLDGLDPLPPRHRRIRLHRDRARVPEHLAHHVTAHAEFHQGRGKFLLRVFELKRSPHLNDSTWLAPASESGVGERERISARALGEFVMHRHLANLTALARKCRLSESHVYSEIDAASAMRRPAVEAEVDETEFLGPPGDRKPLGRLARL
jgi:hypothetical protein